MSVRRLAPEEVQPRSFAFSNDNMEWVKTQLKKFPEGRQASAVIPLLWQAQKQAGGWLPRAAIEHVGDLLGMAYIRVLEVATFYTMFNLEPVGKFFIQLCGTTPCALRGAEKIKNVCRERIGEQGHITADGKFSWLEVECLGACCNAPMVQINDDFYEDLTPENFNALLDNMAAGKPVKIGSQVGRVSSEPLDGVNTLLSPSLYDGTVVGSWRKGFDERFAKAQAAKAAAAAAPPPPAPAAPPAAPLPAKPTAEAKPPIAKTALAEDRPPSLTAARGGKGDNLQLIKGIGPKLEAMLHGMGVFHFDQIAAWTERQLVWVDENLEGFYGRARRDEWIAQARNLAAGGASEKAGGKPAGKN